MSTGWSALGDTFMSEGDWGIGQGTHAPDRQLLRKLLWKYPSYAEPPIDLLEVGMGPGVELRGLEMDGLLEKRVRYTGYDLTPEFVAAARERHPELRFEVRDVQEPMGDEIADVVWCRHVLEHVADGEASLRNLYVATRGLLALSWFIRPTWCEEEVGCVEAEGFLHQTYSARRMIELVDDLGGFLYRFDYDHHMIRGSVWLISKFPLLVLATAHEFFSSRQFLDAVIPVPPDPHERENDLLDVIRDAEQAIGQALLLVKQQLVGDALTRYQEAKTTQARCRAAIEDA